MHGDELIGDQRVVPMLQHAGGIVLHEVAILDMQVSEHFVGTPPSNEGDDFRVNACIEQGVGASSAEAAGGNVCC